MDRERKLHYCKYIVKRHLNDIKVKIRLSKSKMERDYYCTRYTAQLSIYAKALNVQEKYLERYISGNKSKSGNSHNSTKK